MKSANVFLSGLTSVLACNLMLIGMCSSAPAHPMPTPTAPPPPPTTAIVKTAPRPVELSAAVPLGLFAWGCGAHLSLDPEGALQFPICPPIRG